MNKKGFTLVEIISAVIILGILVIIAVITFSGSMKEFRDDYYTQKGDAVPEIAKRVTGGLSLVTFKNKICYAGVKTNCG